MMRLVNSLSLVCGSLLVGVHAVNLRNGPKQILPSQNTLSNNVVGTFGGGGSGHGSGRHRRAQRHFGAQHHHRNLQFGENFDWGLDLEDDWPQIAFEAATEDGEVQFKYNYTGTIDPGRKYIEWQVLRGDCLTEASTEAVVMRNLDTDQAANEITFDIDVLQATITNTPEYVEAPDGLSADIVFCIRGDYVYGNDQGFKESVNFHETNVTVTADLTANFTLTAVNVDRIGADQAEENVQIDCNVRAWFCEALGPSNYSDLGQPRFAQGDIMSVCVEIVDEDRELYHLDDVLGMDLNQGKSDGRIDTARVVINRFPSPLSSKICQNGVCNVRHLIQSKFFDERNPQNLDIAGIALCGFGPVPQFTDRRGVTVSEAFAAAAREVGSSGEEPTNVRQCQKECSENPDCKSMVVNYVGNEGLVGCTYYDTLPATEQTVASDSAEVYLFNSEGVEAPIPATPQPVTSAPVAPTRQPASTPTLSPSTEPTHSSVPSGEASLSPSGVASRVPTQPPSAAHSIVPTNPASPSPTALVTGEPVFINFDDMNPGSSSLVIADGYRGLNWDNVAVMNPSAGFNVNSGFHNGVVSPPVVAFNSLGNKATVERSDETQKITLVTLHATSAWVDGLLLTIEGYRDGAVVGTSNTTLSNQDPTQIDFGSDFADLEKFTFLGSVPGSESTVVVIEDMRLEIK